MRVLQSILGSALILVVITGTAYAQAGTFNGRVLDQGDAVLPGVTVTATNVSTGVSRMAVSNAEGLYYMPGLDPGVYEVKTELAGFSPAARERVTLGVNATITLDGVRGDDHGPEGADAAVHDQAAVRAAEPALRLRDLRRSLRGGNPERRQGRLLGERGRHLR